VHIVRSVVIDCHIEDVFDYVADPRNDPAWRPAVLLVDQVAGDGPGTGARYQVLHHPRGRRAARPTVVTCVDWSPPGRVAWRWETDAERVDVAYALEPVWTSTRLTWRRELRAPRLLSLGAGRDMERQLRALRQRLERH
jgi:Polyketide cyclase / dehydrase and lipid transport